MIKAAAVPATALLVLIWTPIFAQNAGNVPKDVDPDSRSRLPLIKPDDLDLAARKAYDAAAANFAGIQQGSALLRLHGYAGNVVQGKSPLGLPLMQLGILITAREHDQPYEWSLHEMQALAVGLDPAVIDTVRNRKPLSKLPDKEAVIIQLGREIYGAHRLSSETYSRAIELLGKSNFIDVVGLMSDYTRTSATLSAFNQQMPPGWKQSLPLPFQPPDDIHPDSRSRLPLMNLPYAPPGPGSFQSVLYGRELAPRGTGPAHIRGHGSGQIQSLQSSVGRRAIDLAILVTAREHDSQYDWTVNELAAAKDGLEPAVIDVIRSRKPVAGLAEKDACLIEFGRELFEKHYVDSKTYSRALAVFGERDLVDLVDLVMAQHARDAALLATFDQHLPAGQKPLLPLP